MTHTAHNRPIAIDLFAGVGGLALGFEQAGFDVLVAVEIDPVHAAVHQFNFPQCEIIPRSVTEITGKDIRATAGLSARDEISVVIGGAPCQGFSIMGPRSRSDPRNALVKEFVRLVDELRPRYFVFENVKGLTQRRNSELLLEAVAEMTAAGYRLITPWKVLNACDYGVPQNRERLFLIGVRNNLPLPDYPNPLLESPTCEDALADLPDAEQFDVLTQKGEVRARLAPPKSDYAALLRCVADVGWHYGYRRQWNSELLTNSIRTNHSVRSRTRFANTTPGHREPVSHFFRLPPDGVCNTLRAGTDSARGSFTSPRPIHYLYARCITVREMARLHGFPDWFRLHSTKWHGARQIGNSVPPPLARVIATEIAKVLSYRPTALNITLPAGDERLLTMTAEAAAHYWGIKSPIRQREKAMTKKARLQVG